jgi:hypothetical protein
MHSKHSVLLFIYQVAHPTTQKHSLYYAPKWREYPEVGAQEGRFLAESAESIAILL